MVDRMRILFVHYSYWPTVGGVEWVIHEHARLFEKHGHQVRLFEKQPGHSVAEALEGVLRETDLVFAHNILTMPFDMELTVALREAADRFSGVRFVNWVHDIAGCNRDYSDLPGVLSRAHQRFTNVAISELRRLEYMGLTGADCAVVPNGIDPYKTLGLTKEVEALARQEQLFEHDLVLLQPARLLKRKNVELTLAVAAALKAQNVSCRFLITAPADPHNNAASNHYRTHLYSLREQLRVEREILFVSDFFTVTTADLLSLYALADGLFYPSRQEGFGLPVLEAAIHRIPVFCAQTEPLLSLAAERARFFPSEGDPQAIADLLQSIAASELSQHRKHVAREYSWDAIYSKFLKAYEHSQKRPEH